MKRFQIFIAIMFLLCGSAAAQSEGFMKLYAEAGEALNDGQVGITTTQLSGKMLQEVMPASIFPLNTSAISSLTERVIMDAVSVYTAAGAPDKAEKLADALVVECEDAIALYGSEYMGNYLSSDDLQRNLYYIYMLADIFEKNGQPELSKKYADKVSLFLQ